MTTPQPPSRRRTLPRAAALTACAGLLLSGCAGAGSSELGGGKGDHTINVLMVNNPQMVDLQKMTAEHFTKSTGIKVRFTLLPEDDVRDKISQDFSSQAGEYDVATISNYEVPFYARNGWLVPLDKLAAKTPGYDQGDVLAPIRKALTAADGKLYAEPFYGESSFLMYRKDVFAAKHLTMPAHPTWEQVAALAAKADGAEPGMKGICLRGQPGWGQMIAPLTTVVNTFGGTWFTKNWRAEVNSPAFTKATEFYVNLLHEHGEAGAAEAGFTECLNDFEQSKAAMWYDATSAAGSLDGAGSPVAGKVGYVPAPVEKTKNSGWLYSWAFAMQKASEHRSDAWKFISWATGKGYENLVGGELGWSRVPPGTRASTYANPAYRKASAAFADATVNAINGATPNDPGVQPRPAAGIQFVGIPEFAALGDRVSEDLSSAIAGQTSVPSALDESQKLAAAVARHYR